MIHIATVHWQKDQWIDIQLSYLEKHLAEPFKVYAFLNEIPHHHYQKFHFVCDEPIEDHPVKLNILARIIEAQADDDDLLIFLDGDAFPIAPIDAFLEKTLKTHPLTAIVRAENLSDFQPHPSFCATTVGFWKKLRGDWKKGYCWKDSTGMLITDAGGNLLKQLQEKAVNWLPLYRSQSVDKHPLFFGIYHSIIYHHGAGFRPPEERIDTSKGPFWIKYLWLAHSKSRSLEFILSNLLDKAVEKIAKQNENVHLQIFRKIQENPVFLGQYVPDLEPEDKNTSKE